MAWRWKATGQLIAHLLSLSHAQARTECLQPTQGLLRSRSHDTLFASTSNTLPGRLALRVAKQAPSALLRARSIVFHVAVLDIAGGVATAATGRS